MHKVVVIILVIMAFVLSWLFWFGGVRRLFFNVNASYPFSSQKKGEPLPPPPPHPTFKEELSGWLDVAGKVSPLVSTTLAIMSWRKGRRKRR
jgi:hypothetical protein